MKNWEGTEVSTVVAGFQHDLVSVRFALHGDECAADVHWGRMPRYHEVMLLEFGIEIDANADFTQINP